MQKNGFTVKQDSTLTFRSLGKEFFLSVIHTVRNSAQESKRTHLEVICSMMCLIKPKKYKNNQLYADIHLGNIPKDSITG
jgi:hypothetical protein